MHECEPTSTDQAQLLLSRCAQCSVEFHWVKTQSIMHLILHEPSNAAVLVHVTARSHTAAHTSRHLTCCHRLGTIQARSNRLGQQVTLLDMCTRALRDSQIMSDSDSQTHCCHRLVMHGNTYKSLLIRPVLGHGQL